MDKCALCGWDDPPCTEFSNRDVYHVQCPRCGEYVITDEALLDFDPLTGFLKENRHLLSAVARRSWIHKNRLRIDSKLTEDGSEFKAKILSQCPQRTQEKADYILSHIVERSSHPGDWVIIDMANDYPLFFCRNREELSYFLQFLKNTGHIRDTGEMTPRKRVLLEPEGWRRVEDMQRPNFESKQAFVAMWFDGQLDSAFRDGILALENDTGFRMLRIDMKQFNEKICDHIIAEIRRSRFVIADVTGHRQGVYFEAGYAMGLGLPVIWTCHENQVKECHFDTRQYNHVTWKTVEELREKLKDRILATIGRAGEAARSNRLGEEARPA